MDVRPSESSLNLRRVIRCLVPLAVVWGAFAGACLSASEIVADWIFDGLQESRLEAGAPELVRRAELDEVARDRARRVAELPHRRRLAFAEPIDDRLREAGLRLYHSASLHVDMVRGYSNPTAAFLRNWKRYEQAWATAMDRRFDTVGLAIHAASDGWVVFVTIFVDHYDTPQEPRQLERKTIEAVNDVRREHGLAALRPDGALSEVARSHSRDMATRGFFAHVTPEGKLPADRVLERGLAFTRFAENIQKSRGVPDPVSAAVESWMASPGHRAAILEAEYERTGVGVVLADDGILYFTQLFFVPASRSRAPAPRAGVP